MSSQILYPEPLPTDSITPSAGGVGVGAMCPIAYGGQVQESREEATCPARYPLIHRTKAAKDDNEFMCVCTAYRLRSQFEIKFKGCGA